VLATLNLNIFMRHADRVRGTNIAQMANVLQAMILTEGPRMVLTPTYHVYRMYVPFQEATHVPVTIDAGEYLMGDIRLPRLDVVAAKDAQGTLWLSLTNIDPHRPATLSVALNGARPTRGIGQILTAPAVDSHNDFDHPAVVAPAAYSARAEAGGLRFDLPPKSIVVVRVE
jgi:alpha-L-arabinofuranosidase